MKKHFTLAACATLMSAGAAMAADWSDTAVSWRYGSRYAEPYNPEHISKHIVALTHVSGYQYGSTFVNLDLLQSDRNDASSPSQRHGAQEAYLVYRHTLDIGALSATELRFGAVRGLGLTVGFDWNSKNDIGYNSRKRMLVAGPTLMWDVPGFLNTSILVLRESNGPSGAYPPIADVVGRYKFDNHAMLAVTWGIPVAERVSFEGYGNFIAAKGPDEVGNGTGAETNIDMTLMYDASSHVGLPKNRFRVGLEYQFWNNKFGNTRRTTGGKGQRASTPMVRAEYHF